MSKGKITYKQAGVDIDKAESFVNRIKLLVVENARSPQVIGEIGGFGGLFNIKNFDIKEPILVTSADGVGTKLLLAKMQGKFDSIGIDLVAMCVNDIITTGAKPLFFLDYLACGKLFPKKTENIVKGIIQGCKQAECVLLGGETAEMPDVYKKRDFDLAGFCVGIVEKNNIIDGKEVVSGDRIVGIQSNGVHSNGFSLIRKIFKEDELKGEIGKELLTPTLIYARPLLKLIDKVNIKAIAHITGGGIVNNIPRVLPRGLEAVIKKSSWGIPKIFKQIQRRANISDKEMFRTFNMGIGLVVIVQPEDVSKAEGILKNYYNLSCSDIGCIRRGNVGTVIK